MVGGRVTGAGSLGVTVTLVLGRDSAGVVEEAGVGSLAVPSVGLVPGPPEPAGASAVRRAREPELFA